MKISAFVRRSFSEVGPQIILFFLFSIFYSLFSIQSVSAQSINQTAQNSYTAPNTNPNVPNNLHTYSQNVLIEVMSAVSCQLAGVDPTSPSQKCLGVDNNTGKIGYVENGGGAIGFMGNMITMLYTPPAHTGDYIKNLAQNFGITKHAYASWSRGWGRIPPSSPQQNIAGTGFQGLSPLLKIWETFRDFAYLVFVLVFIIVGIAIMLRVKIDPRTVMTIQNQIPKLIIGILLVTFSFAIAGFLIDIMWVAIYLFYGVFASIQGVDVSSLNPTSMQGANPIGAVGGLGGIGGIANHASGSIKSIITSLFDGTAGSVIVGIIGTVIGAGVGSVVPVIGTAIGAVAGGILGTLAGSTLFGVVGWVVAFLIISIALLWALFRVWFALLSAYIMILVDVVFAPFWVVAGLFPGSKLSFNSWVRDMLANLSVFPATIVMFLLGKTFIDAFAKGGAVGQFVPPLIGNPGDIKAFGALIGLGIILTTPSVLKMMKAAFQAPQIDLSSIGAAVGVGAGAPGRLISGGASTAFAPHYKTPPGGGPPQLVYPGGGLGRFLRGFGVVR